MSMSIVSGWILVTLLSFNRVDTEAEVALRCQDVYTNLLINRGFESISSKVTEELITYRSFNYSSRVAGSNLINFAQEEKITLLDDDILSILHVYQSCV